jgi:hypothetical protein
MALVENYGCMKSFLPGIKDDIQEHDNERRVILFKLK